MLTPLQARICRLVDSLPDARSAVLAGGGALIVQGIVDRATTDRDFFSPDVESVRSTAQTVRTALESAGLRDSLGLFDHRRRDEFPVSDDEYERLRTWVHSWRAELPAPQIDRPDRGFER